MIKRILMASACSMLLTCGYFRVTDLSSSKVCAIPSGATLSAVSINYNESGLLDMSFGVVLSDDRVYVKDNIQKKVLVFDRDGKCLIAIGNVSTMADGKEVKKTQVKFDIIGTMVVDADDNLYVQNRLASVQRIDAAGTQIDMSPSFILVFDPEGKLQYTIGQTGMPTVPFYYIEHLEIDKKDRLFVIARTYDIWSVYRFDKRQRDYYMTFTRNYFTDTIDATTSYTGKIENIRILHSGESFILSVAYYHNTRFKYRKLFQYDIKDSRHVELLKISEPKNELFTVTQNKYIYVWNVEDPNEVKFMLYSFDGTIIGNVRCKFPQQALFSDIDITSEGKLYSYHAYSTGLEVYEWK
ncbi:MAG: hypothetical protein N3F66_12425 [Spirochaetes bacterium]|nr:hypothetical protein [Spirochaetota bacterium]